MKVIDKPGVRYLCDGLSKEFAKPMCASLDGSSMEAVVVQAFFDAIQPAQLDALAALLAQLRQERVQLERHGAQQVQWAAYEAHLARRRYDSVDPEHRVVAAERERRWEEALIALRQAHEAAERFHQEPVTPTAGLGTAAPT
jgi:hypothetical protein